MQPQHFDHQTFSDLWKDAYGTRPRFSLEGYSAAELDALWNRTCDALNDTIERERLESLRGQKALETEIAHYVDLGAGDRRTAIRWILQKEDLSTLAFDVEHLCFLWGVDFAFAPTYYCELHGYRQQ